MRVPTLHFNAFVRLMHEMTLLMLVTALLFGTPMAPPSLADADIGGAYDPTADYVVAGQDEPGYRRWVTALPARQIQVKAFNDYLVQYGVGGVVPTWRSRCRPPTIGPIS